MSIVRKFLAKDNYSKIDNDVARNVNISDYSYRLYGFMAGFNNGFQLNDEYIAAALDWSRSKVTRAKRDLTKADLIAVEKIDRSTYFLYIGSSRISATKVKKHWNDQESLDNLSGSTKTKKRKDHEPNAIGRPTLHESRSINSIFQDE